MCYHAEFCHSTSQGILINTGESEKLGSAGHLSLRNGGETDTKTSPLPPHAVLPHQNQSFYVNIFRYKQGEPIKKFGNAVAHLTGCPICYLPNVFVLGQF